MTRLHDIRVPTDRVAGISVACLLPVINPFMWRQMQTAAGPVHPHPAAAAAVVVRVQIINLTNCQSDWPSTFGPARQTKGPETEIAICIGKTICISLRQSLIFCRITSVLLLARKLSNRGRGRCQSQAGVENGLEEFSLGLTRGLGRLLLMIHGGTSSVFSQVGDYAFYIDLLR